MRYLTVVDNYFPDRPEGAPRVALDVALAMRDLGHDVSMLCRAPSNGSYSAAQVIDGIRVLRLAPARIPAAWRIVCGRLAIDPREPMFRLLHDETWDVLHLHTPILGSQVMRSLRGRVASICTVHSPVTMEQAIHWRGGGIQGALRRNIGLPALHRIERELVRSVDIVHVLSDYTAKCLARLHPSLPAPAVVPHWAAPGSEKGAVGRLEARRRLGWPADRPLILTVRGHKARCGIDVAIRAVAPFARSNRCTFVVGGDGPLRSSLQKLASDEGVGLEQISFPGRLSEEQLTLAYRAADLYVLPSVELECFGLTILEAWTAGCPVIASAIGAIPELLGPITPFALVPGGDPAALQAAVGRFLSGDLSFPDDAQLRAHLNAAYNRSILAAKIERLLKSAIATKSTSDADSPARMVLPS